MSRMPDDFPLQLIGLARENQSHELAWQYPTVLEVVAAMNERGYAILGGDVMREGRQGLDYYTDDNVYLGNWYRDWKREGAWAQYVKESVAATVRYIEDYVNMNGSAFWFVPIFADEEAYANLPQ